MDSLDSVDSVDTADIAIAHLVQAPGIVTTVTRILMVVTMVTILLLHLPVPGVEADLEHVGAGGLVLAVKTEAHLARAAAVGVIMTSLVTIFSLHAAGELFEAGVEAAVSALEAGLGPDQAPRPLLLLRLALGHAGEAGLQAHRLSVVLVNRCKVQDISTSIFVHRVTGEAGGYGVQAGGVQGLLVPGQAVPGKVQAAGLVTVARGEAAPDGGHAPLLRRHRRSHLHLHLATGHLGPGGVAPGGHLLALLLAAVLVHQAHEHADSRCFSSQIY